MDSTAALQNAVEPLRAHLSQGTIVIVYSTYASYFQSEIQLFLRLVAAQWLASVSLCWISPRNHVK